MLLGELPASPLGDLDPAVVALLDCGFLLLRNAFQTAFAGPLTKAYTLPTSGLSVSMLLDRCIGCEKCLETARNFALVRLE
jgi:hypothetical protein